MSGLHNCKKYPASKRACSKSPQTWQTSQKTCAQALAREEIVSLMSGDNDDNEETDWDAAEKAVAALDLTGDSIDAPDGAVIEVRRRYCADILEDNGIAV